MAYVIPRLEVELKDIINTRLEATRILSELIKARGKRSDAYVIRDILPKTDLGLANEEWKITYTNAYTWEAKIDKTLEDDKFIVIYGVQGKQGVTPKTLAVKFYKDITPVDVVQIENIFAYREPIGFFTPISWSESERIKVEFYGNASGDDIIVFRGFVAELRKKTIA